MGFLSKLQSFLVKIMVLCLQVAGISVPGCVIGAIPILPICSKVIGLYSGFCPIESEFLMVKNCKLLTS